MRAAGFLYTACRDVARGGDRRDLPYHISALYVVDLAAFRRGAVGDQLRSIYDQLSRDPNSLANLDQVSISVAARVCERYHLLSQDLPNYAQHAVPIFSLPQEWLWYALCRRCVRPVECDFGWLGAAAGASRGAVTIRRRLRRQ